MASGPSRPSRPPPGNPPDPREAHVRDAQIAAIFRDMRKASQQTRDELAKLLGTPVETIEALEAGELLALPEWPETSRVVLAYTASLGLDARPILRRIHSVLLPGPAPSAAREPPEADPSGPTARAADRRMTERPARRVPPRRQRRRLLPWALLLVILVTTFSVALAINQPHLLRSVIDQMPDPILRLTRAGLELLLPAESVIGEASDDPRSRKADKLPQAGAFNR